MLVHLMVTPFNKFASTHLYTWVERATVRVKCLTQEHNTISLARARTWTARSRGECTNDDVTAPRQYSTPKRCITSMYNYTVCVFFLVFEIERDLQNEALKKFQVRSVLSKIYVYRCHDYMQLIALSHVLSDFLMEHTKASLNTGTTAL